MSNKTEIKPKARESVHEVVLNWFKNQQRGSVLDAPAGYGHLSMKLKNMGFTVTAGEIEPEIFSVPDLKCIYMNLNRHIDAPDETFDYTCCIDGLEHMIAPYQAVKEFARVLKPGGICVFSVPNYTNIERRLKFLLRGYFTKPISLDRFTREGANLFNLHNTPLTITVLDLMFKINNLQVVEIKENAPKPKQYLLAGLVGIFWLINLFQREKQKHRTDLTLNKRVILGGNNLIFITRKKR